MYEFGFFSTAIPLREVRATHISLRGYSMKEKIEVIDGQEIIVKDDVEIIDGQEIRIKEKSDISDRQRSRPKPKKEKPDRQKTKYKRMKKSLTIRNSGQKTMSNIPKMLERLLWQCRRSVLFP